ncbi:MAG: hypothetical protein ACOCY8_04790 [Spirochaetota bacterium]
MLGESADGRPLVITIDAGDEWSHRVQAGPFIFNVLPQFAIWAEDDGPITLDLEINKSDDQNDAYGEDDN